MDGWMDTKAEVKNANRNCPSRSRQLLNGLLRLTGDMRHLDKFMEGKQIPISCCFQMHDSQKLSPADKQSVKTSQGEKVPKHLEMLKTIKS